jgi:hypothetical protein
MLRSVGDIAGPLDRMAGGRVEGHELHAPFDAMQRLGRRNQVFGVENPELEPRKEGARLPIAQRHMASYRAPKAAFGRRNHGRPALADIVWAIFGRCSSGLNPYTVQCDAGSLARVFP